MPGPRWIKRQHDPYVRNVKQAELVFSMSGGMLFALVLDCGHRVYMSRGKGGNDYAPEVFRCRACIQAAIGEKPLSRRLSPAEAAVAGYVSGVNVGVMASARAAIALEGLS